MPTIEIQALDTLFFRDGKPFEMGDDNWAEGIFPPPPSVIYGALRTAWFAEHPEEMDKMGKDNDPTKELRITGIFIEYNGQVYTSLPFDFAYNRSKDNRILNREENRNEFETQHLRLLPTYSFASNSQLPFISNSENNIENLESGLIPISDFRNYLEGNTNEIIASKLNKWLNSESKIGVGLDNRTRSSSEGKLYRIGLKRIANIVEDEVIDLKFIVSYISDKERLGDFVPKILKFGAENKTAKVNLFNKDLSFSNQIGKYFKLILLSPAIFTKNSWFPNFGKNSFNTKIELISANVGKSIGIGGFDIKNKRPKKLFQAVPSGSVYYYKINVENTDDVLKELNSINTISEENGNEGFGLFAIGKINSTIINELE